MKKRKYSKKGYVSKNKAVIWSLVGILVIGGAVGTMGALTKGFTDWNFSDNNKKTDAETEIVENGVSVKMLNSITNSDGSITKTFTYSVEPANATNKNVIVSAKFADGTDCTSYVDVSSNNQTITIKTKSVDGVYGWDKKIDVTLTARSNSSATATITLDYVKKIESVVLDTSTNISMFSKDSTNYDFLTYLDITYSRYTIDKTYTFKFDNLDFTIDQNDINASSEMASILNNQFKTEMKTKLTKNSNLALVPNFSSLDFWQLSSSNTWRSWLKEKTDNDFSYISTAQLELYSDKQVKQNYIETILKSAFNSATPDKSLAMTISLSDTTSIVCNEDSTYSYSLSDLGNISFDYYLATYDYYKNTDGLYNVDVDSITSEVTNIQF